MMARSASNCIVLAIDPEAAKKGVLRAPGEVVGRPRSGGPHDRLQTKLGTRHSDPKVLK